MTNDEEIQRLDAEWKQRHQEWQKVHDLYFATGTSTPLTRPTRVLTPEALDEIATARQAEEAAYRRYLEARRREAQEEE